MNGRRKKGVNNYTVDEIRKHKAKSHIKKRVIEKLKEIDINQVSELLSIMEEMTKNRIVRPNKGKEICYKRRVNLKNLRAVKKANQCEDWENLLVLEKMYTKLIAEYKRSVQDFQIKKLIRDMQKQLYQIKLEFLHQAREAELMVYCASFLGGR